MIRAPSFFLNPTARSEVNPAITRTDRAPLAFHQRLSGYQPTPLVFAPELARVLNVGEVVLKDESSRLGLPAFKVLGASWAIYRALEMRVGREFAPWATIEELREQ